MSPQGSRLVLPRLDALLVGGAAVIIWVPLKLADSIGASHLGALSGMAYWLLAGIVAAHFGYSYHLAYSGGPVGVRQHPLALAVLPSVLLVGVVSAWAAPRNPQAIVFMRSALTAVFALTVWHYAKQAYGVTMVLARIRGIGLSRLNSAALRYSLYPLWFLSVARLFSDKGTATMFGYRLGLRLLPGWVSTLAGFAVVTGLILFVYTFASLAAGAARDSGAVFGLALPYAIGFLWIGLPPTYLSAGLILSAAHGMQYLAVVYAAERAWAAEKRQPQPRLWMFSVLSSSAVLGLFASTWLAPIISAVSGRAFAVIGAGCFAMLNLHHYAIDSVIWRSRGDHVRRLVGFATAPNAVEAAPAVTPEFAPA